MTAARGGMTPLHIACQNGHADVADLLLAAGADPELANERGETSFDVARNERRLSITRSERGLWLVQHDAKRGVRRESPDKAGSYLSYL